MYIYKFIVHVKVYKYRSYKFFVMYIYEFLHLQVISLNIFKFILLGDSLNNSKI